MLPWYEAGPVASLLIERERERERLAINHVVLQRCSDVSDV